MSRTSRAPGAIALKPRSLAVRGALVVMLTAAMPLSAQTAEPATVVRKGYTIPAGSLEESLSAFAAAAGVPLSFDPALVAGKQSKGLQGNFSAQEGLNRLLDGSGLELLPRSGGGYTLRRQASAMLPEVEVVANAEENAWGRVNGYAAKRSATATKTDTPIIETPQSISVVGAEEVETRKANNLMDALGYVAGIARSEGSDRAGEYFFIRGFKAYSGAGSIYRDGTKYTVNGFNGQQELYGLERIELLKGASSVLYGTAAPGGVINTVSKRPTGETLRELNVETGSFNRKQVSGDFGGTLDKEGTLSYRITGLKRDSGTFIDHVPDNRTFIAPSFKWQPSTATSLTVLAQHQEDRTAYVAGLPGEGTVLRNPNGKIPRNRFAGEPAFDDFSIKIQSIGYLFEHDFNDQLKLRQSMRHFKSEGKFNYVEIWQLAPDMRNTLYRYGVKRNVASESTTADTSLQYAWSSGAVKHTTLVGFDITRQKDRNEQSILDTAALDLYKPVYGSPVHTPVPSAFYSPVSETSMMGVYLQDQMKIAEKWVVLLGGRYDKVRYDEENFHTGDVAADNEKSSAFTGRAGLVYLADNGVAPYVSFSQSFQPQPGIDRNQSRFEPTRGEQWELGVRYQPQGSNTMLSSAIYELVRTKDLVTDPANIAFQTQRGKVRSRGIELEARTRIGRYTNLIAAYAYTDARTIESSPLTPENEGVRSDGVPYNQFSLWSDYSFGSLGFAGLKAGAGVRYVDSTRGSPMGAVVEVPSFTLLDAMVSYTTGRWKLALNVTNLADKTYIASCTYGCFYGEPRRVIASATYRW